MQKYLKDNSNKNRIKEDMQLLMRKRRFEGTKIISAKDAIH